MPARRMIIMLSLVLSVVLMLAGYKTYWIYQQLQLLHGPKPPVSVATSNAFEIPWQRQMPAAGTLKALQGIDLSTEVPGVVTQLHFESGQMVEAGQPLLQLEHQTEQAELDVAKADQRLARQNFERGQKLVEISAISKGEFDRLGAEFNRNTAVVAQRTTALEKKHIVAPFTGTIGIRQVNVGDYLQSTQVIASLQDRRQLYVDFYVPEQAVQLIRIGQSVQVEVSARPGNFSLAKVSAINPIVDDSTRNVLVRATLPNPRDDLLPGMFANLRVLLDEPTAQTVIQESAIAFSPYGQYVFVITPDNNGEPQAADASDTPPLIAEQRLIETGERRHGLVVVSKGLNKGEQVVTAGQLKLKHGTPVRISIDRSQADGPRPMPDREGTQ
ncbi:efflux RND transporter periplasmic adaptor subunit [Pseudomonas fluorescens]|uniref:efflux RND transporter periplasmic adaptor subunit n=1 Tax=Pseudomonas fluorescens TaxID=294 RepID=UPI00177FDE61|nr:efflux RND transporter periplasmic adaptor subunit [Pseudomonas fluorescens]MBD8098551.1 efflux RND transporter periplasmic adaptor subunit [Pseudomonas fluorescens]MBD8774589.1 efflux RND transporter periplasmic adaptor subunit [Pseudomonas fluorescens]MBD8779952.1 efflux RND transporter periplasmic adaptor subunit [Pseudomonas fluorescens]MBD8796959.1 efflux RND transporter periplasmic adaptor subunit [Pseudomonas fluorescens]